MRTLTKLSVVAAAAATTAILGAGSAAAATVHGPGSAGTVTPTGDYTVCGTVYQGASNPSSGNPLPAGAAAIEGVAVTGQLYNLFNSPVGPALTATSGADGTFCFTGDSSMVPVITLGGKVTLTASPTTVGAATVKLPYSGTIRAAQFLGHKVSGLDSAAGVNIAFN